MSVTVENLTFAYSDRRIILEDISFDVDSGKMLCVLGPNGVGKSTLFRCILGLLGKYQGRITIDEIDIKTMKPKQLARHVAYIPQSHIPVFNYSVFDVALMGTNAMIGTFSTPGQKENGYVEEALELVGITHLKDRPFLNISGGERQLVLIARALAQRAKVLIMDEPTANLDYGNQVRVLSQVKRLSRQGYTVIQSTHHPDQAFLYADEVLALLDGKILSYGSPAKTIDEGLIKSLYGVDVVVERLHSDRARVCIPKELVSYGQKVEE